ncbi:hypothetical protein ACVWY2_007645 [Bradyrhizobium sp. JR6.1]
MTDVALYHAGIDLNRSAGPGLFVAPLRDGIEGCFGHVGLFGQRNEVGDRERSAGGKLQTRHIHQRKAFIGAVAQLKDRRLLHGQDSVEVDRAAFEKLGDLRQAEPHSL